MEYTLWWPDWIEYSSEAKFQTALLKHLKEQNSWWYKLPDTGFSLKPFDMFYLEDGVPFWMELKLFKKAELKTYEQIYKELRPNQIWWLYNFQQAWGQALLVGYCNVTKQTKTFKFRYLEDGNKKEL